MSLVQVVVHADGAALARAAAARLVTRIVDAQSTRGSASIVLTGGSTGTAVLAAVAAGDLIDLVDWSRVDVWWGDERFVPAADTDRNDLQAREALLDRLALDAARVHPFAASDGLLGDDPDAAAKAYADELAAHADGDARVPVFDVLMLGLGQEGHTASIFPGSPAAYDERAVCAVRDCPKPPPTRVSMTFPTLRSATEVWLMTTGAGKASAVAAALAGAKETDIPAAGPCGSERTLWLLDRAAAAHVPPDRLPVA